MAEEDMFKKFCESCDEDICPEEAKRFYEED